MYLILCLMFAGILIGFTVIPRQKNDRLIKAVGHVQTAATVVLLFSMGSWLGGNAEFWQNFRTIGASGILFSVCCVGGSVAVVYLLTRIFLRGESK